MNSLDPTFVSHITLRPSHVASLRVIGEYKGKQEIYTHQSPEALETLRKLATIESVESSNRLEGITAERLRIEGMVLRSAKPKGKSEQEIAGYRDALALVHEHWDTLEFSLDTIQRLHRMVLRYLPESGGAWKKLDNLIIERAPDGRELIRFRPTPANGTPEAMSSLVERYGDLVHLGVDPLITIPLAIFDFLCIHPFNDGNGRLARLLTLLLLYKSWFVVGRYISLERIFEETKETYYEALEQSSIGWHTGEHDILPWLTYFWGVLIRAYTEFEARVGTVTTGYGSKTEQIKLAIDRRTGPFAISEIERECPDISRDMIRHVLRKMRDEGTLKSTGVGRGAKWVKVQGR
jgi:Fic family protein